MSITRTAAEKEASRLLFGTKDYAPTHPEYTFILGDPTSPAFEEITYTDLVKRLESLA